MKILHTADLHLGQIIYQNYDRTDEHRHFFRQLEHWCREEKPDALLVSGDIFDIQQPSASVKKAFTEYFVQLHKAYPSMHIIIVAGNHDSASRMQADNAIWKFADTTLIGLAPSNELLKEPDGWQDNYIVHLPTGYVIALPYMIGERKELLQHLLDYVQERNTDNLPVVMMGHLAVTGSDATGHNFEIGKIATQDIVSLGHGYDYLALGHIHKPQTIGHPDDAFTDEVSYPAPVVRYSGSALHVSCDETFPHTVSLVEIDRHNGQVSLRQLRIDELRHFFVLPADDSSFTSAEDAIKAIEDFSNQQKKGYFRLRIDYKTALPSNFNQMIYDTIASYNDEIRYNPKIIWTGIPEGPAETVKPTFEIADLQQMTDPFKFVEKTIGQYPELKLEEVREAFREISEEVKRMDDEDKQKANAKNKKEQ